MNAWSPTPTTTDTAHSPTSVETLQDAEPSVAEPFTFETPLPRIIARTGTIVIPRSYAGTPYSATTLATAGVTGVSPYSGSIDYTENGMSSRVPHRSAALQALRAGLERFLLLAVIGVSLMVLTKGLGLACLYAGLLALIVGAYRHGLRTGDYLISPRYSILGIVGLAALVLTALIATVEVLIQRGW